MPFNFLFSQGYVERGTRFKDGTGSVGVSFMPGDDELVYFFPIDDSGGVRGDVVSAFRRHYGLEGERICDLLVIYRNLASGRVRFVFADTKGRNIAGVVEQLVNTCRRFLESEDFKVFMKRDYVRRMINNKQVDVLLLCAAKKIMLNSGAVKRLKSECEALQGVFPHISGDIISFASFSERVRRF